MKIPGLRDLQETPPAEFIRTPFILGLRDLQEQLALLSSIKIESRRNAFGNSRSGRLSRQKTASSPTAD